MYSDNINNNTEDFQGIFQGNSLVVHCMQAMMYFVANMFFKYTATVHNILYVYYILSNYRLSISGILPAGKLR